MKLVLVFSCFAQILASSQSSPTKIGNMTSRGRPQNDTDAQKSSSANIPITQHSQSLEISPIFSVNDLDDDAKRPIHSSSFARFLSKKNSSLRAKRQSGEEASKSSDDSEFEESETEEEDDEEEKEEEEELMFKLDENSEDSKNIKHD